MSVQTYKQVEFIKSTGTQYLDTRFYPTSTTTVQSKFIYDVHGGGSFIGKGEGQTVETEADNFRFFWGTDGNTYLDYGSGSGLNRITGTYINSSTNIYEIEFGNRYIKDIPTNTIKLSASGVSFDGKTYTIKIFSQSDYGTIYYCKIFDNNILVRDLVPCERMSDGQLGMFDKVNEIFYEFYGSGSPIAGNYVTSEEYDFITNITKCKFHFVKNSNLVQYKKYQKDTFYTYFSPVGEITGTSGWSNIKYAFDTDQDTYASCGTSTDYIDIVLPIKINISGLFVKGNWVSAVARCMGMRIYNVNESGEETLVATTSIAENTTKYLVYCTFDDIYTNHIRLRLATSNSDGNPPTTVYPTRIISIQLYATNYRVVNSTQYDYDFVKNVKNAIVKKDKFNYFKYIDWEQPIFDSFTTWGVVSADTYYPGESGSSPQYPWQVLDGKTSGGDESDFAVTSGKTVNWYWDFKEPLALSGVTIWSRNNADKYGGTTIYTFYGKEADGSYTEIGTTKLPAVGWASKDMQINTSVYYGIKIFCSSSLDYVGIGELLLDAKQVVKGTINDYDFTTIETKYYAIRR